MGIARNLLIVLLFTLSGPPWDYEGQPPKIHHKIDVFETLLQSQLGHSDVGYNPYIFIHDSLYRLPRWWTPLAQLVGLLQGSTYGMLEGGALALPGVAPTVGLLPIECEVLHKSVCTPKWPKQHDPSSCPLWIYIVGDTLHHQPIGMGHMITPSVWANGVPFFPNGVIQLQSC